MNENSEETTSNLTPQLQKAWPFPSTTTLLFFLKGQPTEWRRRGGYLREEGRMADPIFGFSEGGKAHMSNLKGGFSLPAYRTKKKKRIWGSRFLPSTELATCIDHVTKLTFSAEKKSWGKDWKWNKKRWEVAFDVNFFLGHSSWGVQKRREKRSFRSLKLFFLQVAMERASSP